MMPRPDGQALVYWSSSGEIWTHPLTAGTDRRVPRDTRVLRWSPDGAALWVHGGTDQRPRVDRLDLTSGRRTPLVDIDLPRERRIFQLFGIYLADDPRTYAYILYSYNSQLFTMARLGGGGRITRRPD